MYDGTWGGGPVPQEIIDFETMRRGETSMGWSWTELQATPAYVRRFCSDLMEIRNRNLNRRH